MGGLDFLVIRIFASKSAEAREVAIGSSSRTPRAGDLQVFDEGAAARRRRSDRPSYAEPEWAFLLVPQKCLVGCFAVFDPQRALGESSTAANRGIESDFGRRVPLEGQVTGGAMSLALSWIYELGRAYDEANSPRSALDYARLPGPDLRVEPSKGRRGRTRAPKTQKELCLTPRYQCESFSCER